MRECRRKVADRQEDAQEQGVGVTSNRITSTVRIRTGNHHRC